MTAAQTLRAPETELERIERWRAEELERVGYSAHEAARVAARHDIDLHLALDLVSSGCSAELALQILL